MACDVHAKPGLDGLEGCWFIHAQPVFHIQVTEPWSCAQDCSLSTAHPTAPTGLGIETSPCQPGF